jgi:DNA-binding transcriptional MerR regulator
MMTIGTFSRASSLSIKALRAYHEAGILVPARVDPASGYRSYTVDQLADAAVIVRLRALDVPLEQVGRVLRARDPELTRAILAEHHIRMSERLVATERIVAELQAGTAPTTHTPVHVTDEAAMHTLRMRRTVTDDELWPWVTSAHERIVDHLVGLGATPAGPASALYLPEIPDDGIEEVEAFVPIREPFELVGADPDIALGEVPAARVAVLVHAGGYDTIADTYRLLGAWVARHASPSGERIRERYLVGPPPSPRGALDEELARPEQYRTEIAWPIASSDAGS